MTNPVAPVFATVYREGEWPLVAALGDAIALHHPGAVLHALALDGADPTVAGSICIARPAEIGLSGTQCAVLRLTASDGDARMAVAPLFVAHLLGAPGTPPVRYLTPDTVLRAALPEMPAAGLAMIPRLRRAPEDDGRTPTPADLLALSLFDDGFLAAAPDTREALWASATAIDPSAIPADGALARTWDLLAATIPTTVLDDQRLGVAYWNATTHDGPIVTMRLPGLDPAMPFLLSAEQGERPRVLLSEHRNLQAIVDERVADLAAHGMTTAPGHPRIGDLVVDDAVRAACRSAVRDDPAFADTLLQLAADPSGEMLAAWLGETAPGSREPRISRYLLGIWAADSYANAAFPNPRDDHSEHLIRWARASSDALGIPSRFLPRATTLARPAHDYINAEPVALEPGVNLIGFLRAGFGVGEATRLLHEALIDGDIPHAAISVSHDDLEDMVESSAEDQALLYDINLICVNVDWLDMLSRRLGSDLSAERYFIGTWWWESNVLPPDLAAQIDYFDELWAGSTYVADSLSAYTDHPIRVFPLPVRVPPDEPAPDRASIGLPEGFLFMFSFDFNSTVERKNPEGVITAFRRAFPDGGGPQLVIKTINGHRHLVELERLRALSADRDDVMVFDGFLPTAERDGWARATDCYVSLHRSEGFGLTMAEAMALGTPVIATAYSANLDFMDADTAWLVPAEEWVLDQATGPYPAGTRWATPDIDAAAAFMRQAAGDPAAAAALGARARAHIAETRTTHRLAEFVTHRLEEIRMEDRQLRPRPNSRLPAQLNDALSYDRQRMGMHRGFLGRLINKIIRPYSATADELDRRTLAAMVEIAERFDDLERQVDGMEQTVEMMEATAREERQGDGPGS